jgi:hypothetical protein
VGVPRCSPATCVAKGGACASSADCCGGVPCVPNAVAGAAPPFVCYGEQCVDSCGACTTSADCCPGSSCILPSGSSHGLCGPCGGGTGSSGASTGTSTGSSAGSGSSSGSPVDSGTPPVCSMYGQLCQASADCCSGLACSSGRCGIIYVPR